MWKAFYSGNAHLDLALIALGFFVAFFLGVVVWTIAVKRAADFNAVAALPLNDSPPAPEPHHER